MWMEASAASRGRVPRNDGCASGAEYRIRTRGAPAVTASDWRPGIPSTPPSVGSTFGTGMSRACREPPLDVDRPARSLVRQRPSCDVRVTPRPLHYPRLQMRDPRYAHFRLLGATLAAVSAATILGCAGERTGAGPRPGESPTTDPELGEDAPINLSYICGNRFMITN